MSTVGNCYVPFMPDVVSVVFTDVMRVMIVADSGVWLYVLIRVFMD